MLKASGIQAVLSAADIETALAEHAGEKVQELRVELEDGALLAHLKVPLEAVRLVVPVDLRLTPRHTGDTGVELGVQWINLPLLPGALKQTALRHAFEALPGLYEDGVWRLELLDLLDDLPVGFRLTGLEVRRDGLRISLADVVVLDVEPARAVPAPAEVALVPVPAAEEARLPEHQSYYHQLRERLRGYAGRAPKWAQPLTPWVLAVPDFFVLLVRLTRDPRVPTFAKVVAGAAVAYFVLPLDLMPDALPFVGQVDDLAFGLYVIDQVTQRVPASVVQELWPGDGEVIDLVHAGLDTVNVALPAKLLVAVRRLVNRSGL